MLQLNSLLAQSSSASLSNARVEVQVASGEGRVTAIASVVDSKTNDPFVVPPVALGAGLTFSPPLYAPYLAAPRIWGISAATDQQLGGLIMWSPGNIFYIVIVSILFIRWMQKQEAKQRASEAEMYEDVMM